MKISVVAYNPAGFMRTGASRVLPIPNATLREEYVVQDFLEEMHRLYGDVKVEKTRSFIRFRVEREEGDVFYGKKPPWDFLGEHDSWNAKEGSPEKVLDAVVALLSKHLEIKFREELNQAQLDKIIASAAPKGDKGEGQAPQGGSDG